MGRERFAVEEVALTLVTCAHCGHEFEVETRAPIGQGTQAVKDKKTLNRNEMSVGHILSVSDKNLTVRQVQAILYQNGVKRQQRREKEPSGQWNYQQVQATLSNLVGMKLITMTRTKEFLDDLGFGARPIPHYFMTPEQKEKFKEIRFRNGQIQLCLVTLCPKCGHAIG